MAGPATEHERFIDPEDYTYDLPQDRIAAYPLPERDQSRLLFYHKGKITHHKFPEIISLLPEGALLFFNNTRVIPARLHFRKPTGAIIEIFLLNPVFPSGEIARAMNEKHEGVWKCMIGNLKRWHDHSSLTQDLKIGGKTVVLTASIDNAEEGLVRFRWEDPRITFSEIITELGQIPLPPYINRDPVEEDKIRYQTVYSRIEGAVASSTAGLHFTDKILDELKQKNFGLEFITLHIGAGTFQPIKTSNAVDHNMHREQLSLTRENVIRILNHPGPVIPVGTTAMRTLESMYWFGVDLLMEKKNELNISRLQPYEIPEQELPPLKKSLQAILDFFDQQHIDKITGETGIYILPGYKFRICNGLVTNFHLPGSTLILLVAAFTGIDWKRIYTEAIMHDYRFLSYGDSSLIIP